MNIHSPKGKSIAVIGAGFFGLYNAIMLAEKGYEVKILERNSKAMGEASLYNQARIHGGYHYPRSIQTGARSRFSYTRFTEQFSSAVRKTDKSIYAIANGSRISAQKFQQYCKVINAPLENLTKNEMKIFQNNLIEKAFIVEEDFFDSNEVLQILINEVKRLDIDISFSQTVTSVVKNEFNSRTRFTVTLQSGETEDFDKVVVTTYGMFDPDEKPVEGNLTFEVCELVELDLESPLLNTAITIMDGPFWSLTPWPAFSSSVLTHVRLTPHARFDSARKAESYVKVAQTRCRSRDILADASRYVPLLRECSLIGSHFVVKTILKSRDKDDARPIVAYIKNEICFIIGGKIDNVYDSENFVMAYVEGRYAE